MILNMESSVIIIVELNIIQLGAFNVLFNLATTCHLVSLSIIQVPIFKVFTIVRL